MSRSDPRPVQPGELKALVRQLVLHAGGVEACGVELGVSGERISQLQRTTCPDQMPLLMVSRLEAVIGRALVTGALARAVEGGAGGGAIGDETVEAVGSAAALMGKVHAMEADGRRTGGELREVQLAAALNLREAQEAFDAAMALTPCAGGGA